MAEPNNAEEELPTKNLPLAASEDEGIPGKDGAQHGTYYRVHFLPYLDVFKKKTLVIYPEHKRLFLSDKSRPNVYKPEKVTSMPIIIKSKEGKEKLPARSYNYYWKPIGAFTETKVPQEMENQLAAMGPFDRSKPQMVVESDKKDMYEKGIADTILDKKVHWYRIEFPSYEQVFDKAYRDGKDRPIEIGDVIEQRAIVRPWPTIVALVDKPEYKRKRIEPRECLVDLITKDREVYRTIRIQPDTFYFYPPPLEGQTFDNPEDKGISQKPAKERIIRERTKHKPIGKFSAPKEYSQNFSKGQPEKAESEESSPPPEYDIIEPSVDNDPVRSNENSSAGEVKSDSKLSIIESTMISKPEPEGHDPSERIASKRKGSFSNPDDEPASKRQDESEPSNDEMEKYMAPEALATPKSPEETDSKSGLSSPSIKSQSLDVPSKPVPPSSAVEIMPLPTQSPQASNSVRSANSTPGELQRSPSNVPSASSNQTPVPAAPSVSPAGPSSVSSVSSRSSAGPKRRLKVPPKKRKAGTSKAAKPLSPVSKYGLRKLRSKSTQSAKKKKRGRSKKRSGAKSRKRNRQSGRGSANRRKAKSSSKKKRPTKSRKSRRRNTGNRMVNRRRKQRSNKRKGSRR